MKIGIIGYGKMGRMVEQEATAAGHEVSFTTSSENDAWGKADVLIEFTHPEAIIPNLHRALDLGIPMVTGTTGWNQHLEEIEALVKSKEGSFLHASNFSIGVNIFFEINRQLAHIMASQRAYRVHIEETHHTEKKDSPSGTAITAANGILESQIFLSKWALDHSKDHDADILPIRSHRLPDVPGKHIVKYESSIDSISLTHEAKSRKGFAQGAILAAEWLSKRKGVFTMKDILSFNR